MKPCTEDLDLSAYLDQMLPVEKMQKVEAHLNSCPACRERLGQLRVLRDTKITVPGTSQSLSESFYQGVYARIESRRAAKRSWWNMPVKVAATVCTLLLVVLVTREARKSNPPAVTDVASVEQAADDKSSVEKAPRMVLQETSKERIPAPELSPNDTRREMKLKETGLRKTMRASDIAGRSFGATAANKKDEEELDQNSANANEPQIMDRLASPQRIQSFEPPEEALNSVIGKKKAGTLAQAEVPGGSSGAHQQMPAATTSAAAPMAPNDLQNPKPVAIGNGGDRKSLAYLNAYPFTAKAVEHKSAIADGEQIRAAAPSSLASGGGHALQNPSYAIRDSVAWKDLWDRSADTPEDQTVKPPSIDFNRFMVVAVANPDRAHQSARILTVETSDSAVLVRYSYEAFDSDDSLAPPLAYKIIPRSTLPVQFKQVQP